MNKQSEKPRGLLSGKTVLLCVTGGIAAYKMPNVARMLKKLGCNVHVLMTQNATNFITATTFETLTANKCLIDTFDRNFEFSVEHVALAKQADLVLIAPADHALAQRASTLFAQVLDYPFVMLHAGSAIHTFTMNAAAALGRHLEVRIQVRSFEAVCRMVSAGVGVGLVPLGAVPAGTSRGSLAVIELDEPWAQRDLKVCVRNRESLSGFSAALLACLVGEG